MPLSNRQICEAFFQPDPVEASLFECICGSQYRQTASSGYQNLINHLRRAHPGYESQVQPDGRPQRSIVEFVHRTGNAETWADWIVSQVLPLSFCESPATRQYTKLKPITRTTLKAKMFALMGSVEDKIREHLPAKFGVVFDGWACAGVHFVALLVVFEPTERVLLVFSTFDDETDLGSQSMFDFIADTLEEFHRPWECVLFCVGDNCSSNQSLGSRGGIPFVGCASHRFNLAVKLFLEPHEDLLAKANGLMKRLTTIKGRACLKKVTPLRTKIRNDTRWSSTFSMLKRCVKILPALRLMDDAEAVTCSLRDCLLSAAEGMKATALLKDLQQLNSVTKKLQDPTVTIAQVRTLFDYVVVSYPITTKYLAPKASIVNNPAFEAALVKLQEGGRLTTAEKTACAGFIVATTAAASGDGGRAGNSERGPSFAEEALKRRRICSRQAEAYLDTSFVPPTSNLCERLFSLSKLVFSEQRRRMNPATLEMLIFLKANRVLWK